MKFSLEKFFYPIFFLLFLFSFFLIEGSYRFYLFASWSLFLFSFNFLVQNKQSKKNEKSSKYSTLETSVVSAKAVKIALLLSLFFTISTFFSTHLPLSLEKLIFYLVALAIFIFFIRIPRDKFDYSMFFSFLALISLILNFIVLFFTFYVPDRNIFPGMNLLVRSFGHNHYAAYLLLVVPVFWWQLLFAEEGIIFSKKESRFLAILLLISSYLLIILTLARLVLFIAALQLILIFLINKKDFFSSLQSNLVRVMVKFFIFVFLSISLIFLFLSLPLKLANQTDSDICPLLLKRKELCKPLIQNDRFMYWQKALYILESKPLFGSGLKTFNFASRQFPLESYQITSYAHNIFLHNLAETGLLTGGLFIFFVLYLFYQSFKVLQADHQPLFSFLWLAAAASLFNAMFDFDWHFFVIFVLSLVFLALILQSNSNKTKKTNLNPYFSILAISTTLLCLAFVGAEILYKSKRLEVLIKFSPYLNYQMSSLESADLLSTAHYQSLYPLYRNDPNFIYGFATADDTLLEKRVELQIELAKLDPSFFVKNVYFGNLNYLQASELTKRFVDTLSEQKMINNVYFLDYWRQVDLAKQFFTFADQAYLAKEPELAVFYYKQATFLDPHIMAGRKPVFLENTDLTKQDDFDRAAIFLRSFQDFNPDIMTAFYEYMGFYEKILIYLFENNRLEEFYILAEAIFKQQPNFSWFLWRDLIAQTKTPTDRIKLENIHDHFKEMKTWNDFWPLKN